MNNIIISLVVEIIQAMIFTCIKAEFNNMLLPDIKRFFGLTKKIKNNIIQTSNNKICV